jgi:hypothetical protein
MAVRSVLLIVLLGLVAAPARAQGPAKGSILDEAGLFSAAARKQAAEEIAEIRAKAGPDLVVETRKELPAETEREKNAWWKAPVRRRALLEWAHNRAEELGVDGLYIVIFNGPTPSRHDVRVVGWPAGREVQVSWVKRNELRKELARELRNNPDRALLGAIDTFRAQMELIREPDPSPLTAWEALIVVGSLVGLWLVLAVIRSRVARRGAAGEPPSPLYQPATMGALFGVPAAFWVHDQLFRFIPPEAPPAELPPDMPTPGEEPSVNEPTTP